jgi:hypothetical protein
MLLLMLANNSRLRAEGTPSVMPNSSNGTGIYISTTLGAGPYRGAPTENRVEFVITNNVTQNLYFNFKAYNRAVTPVQTAIYYRILDQNTNTVRAGPTLVATGSQISTYAQAVAGPNISGLVPAGYTPITFDPTIDGHYYIELYPSSDGGVTASTTNIIVTLFDFTVATAANVKFPGRLHSKAWSFITYDPTTNAGNLGNALDGDFFGYTADSTVVNVDFLSGFRPLGFTLYMNKYGAVNGTNWVNDRRSQNTGAVQPSLPAGYDVFLESPDVSQFPIAATASAPTFAGKIYGCAPNIYIPYGIDKAGDVVILLDINGTPGYQAGTRDRYLYFYDQPVGRNVGVWDGLDGLGAAVTGSTTVNMSLSIRRGRVNLPMYDAELNSSGLNVTGVSPLATVPRLYFDDNLLANTALTTCSSPTTDANNNITGGGITNADVGVLSPGRAWDGAGSGNTVPAPTGGGGSTTISLNCDDYGNVRTLNTWFWAYEISTGVFTVTVPTCSADGDAIAYTTDVDDDNDGMTDIVEGGGTDPMADADLDGIPNAFDTTPGGTVPVFVDANNDGVNDNYDFDLDGIVNSFDLDSDNDGIPDIIEAGGVDTDGNGRVDSNVDFNNNGLMDTYDPLAVGGVTLASRDTDGDGVPNRFDLDSDNDGIPDIRDAGGTDADNNGTVDVLTDSDGDGYVNSYDPDDDNNGTNESPLEPLIVTGADTNADGLADSYTRGDFDRDGKPNPYDLDADGDGILDVREAGLPDANTDGLADGTRGADGWSDTVDALAGPLVFPNTDNAGGPNFLDIDSDNDGIVDIIEAQTTAGYLAPLGTDTDNDGIDNRYDNLPNAFGGNTGNGLVPTNTDAADNPDYTDTDSDNDGKPDSLEGWDTNGNGSISGVERAGGSTDADADGLLDGWDNNTALVNPTNGMIPTNFPDVNNPGGDRDWRQTANSDNDTIADNIDIDDDNDGVPDTQESVTGLDPLADANANGIPNYLDPAMPGYIDTNADGIDDRYDIDLDGVINSRDLDSDNDGIPDIIEAGGVDTDGNGRVDGTADTNNNGLIDTYDAANGGVALPNRDTDGDTIPNSRDLDSDNDGIPDIREAGGVDADNDGKVDATADADGDGYVDAYDPDDDNNGTNESPLEPLIVTGPDTNADGRPDSYTRGDFERDGKANPYDLDADGDGILDAREAGMPDANNDGIADGPLGANGWSTVVDALPGPLTFPNTDGVTNPNYLDIDSDNDGIVDNIEGQSTAGYITPSGSDTDNDGIDNAYDNLPAAFGGNASNGITPVNTDAADTPDYTDLDTDNDGKPDYIEGWDTNGNGTINGAEKTGGAADIDADGLLDGWDNNTAAVIPSNGTTPTSYPDVNNPGGDRDWRQSSNTDNDAIPDNVDIDDDNDGVPDVQESTTGLDPLGDLDSDGIPNYLDTSNPGFVDTNTDGIDDRYDTDLDGVINSRDLDSDNDGIPDIIEAGGVDTDGNGRVDGTADTNNNGLIDTYDPANGGVALPNRDTDGDGVPNSRDLDSDNDGIPDIREAGGADANNDGMADAVADVDGDGYVNTYDPDDDNNGVNESPNDPLIVTGPDTNADGRPDSYTRGDFDRDGIVNPYDLDSDADGILDVREAGLPDADGNGITDAPYGTNGWSTAVDALPGPLVFTNTDGTGGPDYLDIDADNDGIVDNIEGQATALYIAPAGADTDGDGINNAYDNLPGAFGGNANNGIVPVNTDGTDNPDYRDLNTDNDARLDAIEGWDTDGDGVIDGAEKTGGVADIDADGLLDGYDNNTAAINPTNGTTPASYPDVINPGGDRDWRQISDNDNDGVNDIVDVDDDNDGVPDSQESITGLDPLGDLDGDGTPNYHDQFSPGFIDTNGDGIDDRYDTDLDGVINSYDLDSDNDGIPDIVEAGGVDTNGDGRVDVFADADGDGLATIYDSNNGGVAIANLDTDTDGIPNARDLDSDNDGIPDIREAGGADGNNNGKVDTFTDIDHDGFTDQYDGDAGNDGIAENTANALIPTGTDTNADGRPDSYTKANNDRTSLPNPYDLDSDGDGILDAREAGIADTDNNGVADGTLGANGWSTTVQALPTLTLPNFDGGPLPDYLDIDSDNDGITDNLEGQSTAGYILPSGVDTDNDGIDNSYDNTPGAFAGSANNGITPWKQTGNPSALPDYLNHDSDADGVPDIVEAHDYNLNNLPDDDVTLTNNDADGDGLDDKFDLATGPNVTHQGMLNGGAVGDPATPGARGPLQKRIPADTERQWRNTLSTLPLKLLSFSAKAEGDNKVRLNWESEKEENFKEYIVERSTDGVGFTEVGTVAGKNSARASYTFDDNLGNQHASKVYYRLRMVDLNEKFEYSKVVAVTFAPIHGLTLLVTPNPSSGSVALKVSSEKNVTAVINIIDQQGRILGSKRTGIANGVNIIFLTEEAAKLPSGMYTVILNTGEERLSAKMIIQK